MTIPAAERECPIRKRDDGKILQEMGVDLRENLPVYCRRNKL
jgi:hypothetical protein